MDRWSGWHDCDECGRRGRRRLVRYGGRAYCYACCLGVMRAQDATQSVTGGARGACRFAGRRLRAGIVGRRAVVSVRRALVRPAA
jgi:hypothetical protein